MKRPASWCLFIAAWLVTASALAQTALRAGDFVRLDPPQPVATGSAIEVIEFFYYGCPICYELQPQMSRWLVQAPNYIALRRIPAKASETWEIFAKLYFSLEALGEIQRLHWPVYDNFHFDGVRLNDEKVMLDWVTRNGITRERFLETYNSPDVQAKVDLAAEMMKRYDVRGVPTIVVDGKYLSSARLAGGTRQLMQVVDKLVQQARAERPQ